MTLELAEDRRHRVAGECDPAVGIEAVERLDEPEARDLDEVVQRLAVAAVARGEAPREGHEAARELLAHDGVLVLGVATQQRALVRELLVRPWLMLGLRFRVSH